MKFSLRSLSLLLFSVQRERERGGEKNFQVNSSQEWRERDKIAGEHIFAFKVSVEESLIRPYERGAHTAHLQRDSVSLNLSN
jgi:hypothetical protein